MSGTVDPDATRGATDTTTRRRGGRWKLLVQSAISALALFLVLRLVSGREFLAALAGAAPAPLAVALALVVIDRVLMAAKWSILLRAQGIVEPLPVLIRSYFVATFYGSFLPTGVGGDVIRVIDIARGREAVGPVTASVIMERILGLLALAALALVTLGVFVLRVRSDILPLLGVVLGALVLGTAVLLWALHGRIPARLARLIRAFRNYAGHRGALMRFFLYSMIEHLVPVAAVYAMARALGLGLPFWVFLVIIPLELFVTRIPISLDGIGVREGLYVALFGQAGLTASEAFVLAIVGRVVTLVGVLPGCFLGMGRGRRGA